MIRVIAVMDSTGPGGAETSMAAVAPFMREHGIELEVAYFVDRVGVKDQLLGAGIGLWHVPPGKTRLHTILRLRKLIKQRQPDLVHTMIFEADVLGRVAAFMSRRPVVSSLITDSYSEPYLLSAKRRYLVRFGQILDATTAQYVRGFHAVSAHVANEVPRRLAVRRKPVRVVHRGRDLTRFRRLPDHVRERERRNLGISPQEQVFIVVARQELVKGISNVIAAVAQNDDLLDNARLLLVGQPGTATTEINRQILINGLGSKVIQLGHRSDVEVLLNAADIAICSSMWEGFPGAALEARLCSLPIVASRIPALEELAHIAGGDDIYFFDSHDVRDLGMAMRDAATSLRSLNPEESNWREAFSLARSSERLASFYYEMVELNTHGLMDRRRLRNEIRKSSLWRNGIR